MRLIRYFISAATIFLAVSIGTVLTTESAAASCADGFAFLGGGPLDRIRYLASEHGSQARVRTLVTLQFLAEKQNQYGLKWGPPRAYGSIEPLPQAIMPKDPKMAAVAVRVNEMFQSEKEILSFVEATAKRAAESHAARAPGTYNPQSLLPAGENDLPFLQAMADEQGWGKIQFAREILEPDDHRNMIIGSGKLHYDLETANNQHPSSAHILQWLMITPKLEAEFGRGTAQNFMRYMSTSEGYRVWINTFDRGPTYFRDMRGPQMLNLSQIAGRHSWLGVR